MRLLQVLSSYGPLLGPAIETDGLPVLGVHVKEGDHPPTLLCPTELQTETDLTAVLILNKHGNSLI